MKRPTWLALAVLLTAKGAGAQSDRELATRQELITEANALSDDGKHDAALAVAKRAAAIKMTPSLRLFLAREQSSLGLLADAYGNGRQCRVEAEADGRLNNRARILSACKDLETSLGKRVGRLTLRVVAPVPPPRAVQVTVSGEEVNAALLGEPYVVSPGKLAVTAKAPGFLPWTSEILVAEGAAVQVDVSLLPDASAQACPEGQERVHGGCTAACPDGRVRADGEGGHCCFQGQTWSAAASSCTGVRTCPPGLLLEGEACIAAAPGPPRSPARLGASLTLGAVGLAGIAVGSVFGAMAASSWSKAKGECPTHVDCSPEAVHDQRTTTTNATVSTVAFIAGGAFAAAGITVFLTAPRATSPSLGMVVKPGNIALRGSF